MTTSTVMDTDMLDRRSLRLAAMLLLVGQLMYILITLLHTGGEANNHPAIFAAYAVSDIWTGVHVAQFACMAIMLAGFLALFFAMDAPRGTAGWAARFGAASTVATLAIYGVVLGVDGVALKQAVNAWASAPEAEKAARFAVAEGMRWLEWGTRSYENFTLGLSVLLFAIAMARTARVPRPIPYLMGLSTLAYWVQGWAAGTQGFSQTQSTAIVLAEVLNATWMVWLLVVARRMPDREPASLGR
ncbi:MAG TPA: hypothetical protein VL484_04725 [Vicinamibacterales bacterium]|nr:hypothetical protein [Vicinamibacterales bacterium]